jgi:hypothetical protein
MVTRPFESKIQDLVYNVDVGIGNRLVRFFLYLAFVLGIVTFYTASEAQYGLRNAEAMDYAQVARNLMNGEGFTTKYIRPASMWYLIEHSSKHDPMMQRHPDIVHPPLYPAVLSVFFRALEGAFTREGQTTVYPPEKYVVVPLGHLCTLLTALFLFLTARRLFVEPRVATLGVTLYFLSDSVWRMSISGLGISLTTLLTTLAVYLAIVAVGHREEGRPTGSWVGPLAGSALCCAAAALTRYGAVVMIPALALFIGVSFGKTSGIRWAAVYVLIAAIGISPWLARNKIVSGGMLGLAPYMALNGYDPVQDNDFERTLAPKLAMGKTLRELQQKLLLGLAGLYEKNLRTLGDGVLVCLFLTTFFFRFSRDAVHRLRWCIALALLLTMVLASYFGAATEKLLFLFWPFAILYGLAFFFVLLDRLQLRLPLLRIGTVSAFVMLNALPLIFTLLPPRSGPPYPPYYPPYITRVSRLMEPDELLCTDMPWATAWYGDRNSLLLPLTIDNFYDINDFTKPIRGMYFTTLTRDRSYVRTLLTGSYRTWFPILEGRIPADFPLTQGFPLNNLDQLFLTDRPRWEAQRAP